MHVLPSIIRLRIANRTYCTSIELIFLWFPSKGKHNFTGCTIPSFQRIQNWKTYGERVTSRVFHEYSCIVVYFSNFISSLCYLNRNMCRSCIAGNLDLITKCGFSQAFLDNYPKIIIFEFFQRFLGFKNESSVFLVCSY